MAARKKKRRAPPKRLSVADMFGEWWKATYGYELTPERKVMAPHREWRYDYSHEDARVVIEIEGGLFAGKRCHVCKQKQGGRHNSPTGFTEDCWKYNLASLNGWTVFRLTTGMLLEDADKVTRPIHEFIQVRTQPVLVEREDECYLTLDFLGKYIPAPSRSARKAKSFGAQTSARRKSSGRTSTRNRTSRKS